MAINRPVVTEAKNRKATGDQRAPLPRAAAREGMVSPAEIATQERTAAFDPRLFLTKLVIGKTCREYRDK
jgi:hypothetical protein